MLVSFLAACSNEGSSNSSPTGSGNNNGGDGNTDGDTTPNVTENCDTINNSDEEPDSDFQIKCLIETHQLSKQTPRDRIAPAAQGALFELGRELFFTTALSADLETACVSCHHPNLGGGDSLSLPIGVDAINSNILGPGRTHDGDRDVDILADGAPNVPRNSQTTFNIILYDRAFFWDGRIEVVDKDTADHGAGKTIRTPDSLIGLGDVNAGNNLSEAQARFPISSSSEMFGHSSSRQTLKNSARRELILKRLRGETHDLSTLAHNDWLTWFQNAFDDSSSDTASVITLERVATALATYQQSQFLIDNRWLTYLFGDNTVLSDEEKRGAILFMDSSEEGGYNCISCHSSNNFSDEKFHNLAMPQFGRGKNIGQFDTGRLLASSDYQDKYRFRTPSLLNTEVTGPWGHTGAYTSLEGIVRHHLNIETAVNNYDYSLAPLKQFQFTPDNSVFYQSLTTRALDSLKNTEAWDSLPKESVNETHLTELVAFLKTLTDPCTQDISCMAKWLPDSSVSSPDGQRLVAQFSNHNAQINSYTTPPDDIISPDKLDNGLWFTDVSVAVGFDYELVLTDNPSSHSVLGSGVAVDDYDGDGWDDIFISHAIQPGKLFRNNKNGTFTETTDDAFESMSSVQLGAFFFDIDNDTDLDLLLNDATVDQGVAIKGITVYENNGSGIFTPLASNANLTAGWFTYSLSAGDIDGDSDLDLFTPKWGLPVNVKEDPISPTKEFFWLNNADGTFTDTTPEMPITSTSTRGEVYMSFTGNFVDIDGDHDSDLLISGDFGTSQVLINRSGESLSDGETLFADTTSNSEITDENGMGSAIGDFDNDGDLDWFVTSIYSPFGEDSNIGGITGNRLYKNNGSGVFSEISEAAGVRLGYWGWGTCFADFNNDGWLDIFHTNGYTDYRSVSESSYPQFLNDPSRLFINNQDGTFSDKSDEYGITHTGQGRGISCVDYDKDGDVDILIANLGLAPTLLRNNDLDNKNYINIQLSNPSNNKNRDAIGAKIWLTTGSQTQFRQIRMGSNYLGNNPTNAHFGLGDVTTINEIKIRWPDGVEETRTNVAANEHLLISR